LPSDLARQATIWLTALAIPLFVALLAKRDPDPARAMRLVPDRLGARPDGILWTVIRRRLWSKLLMPAAVVVIAFVALERLPDLG
jgi:hypothetical protein